MLNATRVRTFGGGRGSLSWGLVASALVVALGTAAIYPLKLVAPALSLGVVYLPGVLLVSVYWGLGLGLFTSLASALAFNFFHVPPVGRLTITDGRNLVALVAFTLAAAVVSTMADVARGRTIEAERRRTEADLAASLARELLGGARTPAALGGTARRVAQALAISSASVELGVVSGGERQSAVPLRDSTGEQIATLVIPRDLPGDTVERLLEQVVPALQALVAIALRRDEIQAEAVETAALRRSDELKTALLRAVSHDLRSPITAMVTAGHALGLSSLSQEERAELSGAVVDQGERLSALIDKLFDLSRLTAGRAEPRREWILIAEVLMAARDSLGARAGAVRLIVDKDAPALVADAAQLERVFANLLENALRYGEGQPVVVHARRAGSNVVVRVVDKGPGIDRAEQERIFEPFYRGGERRSNGWTGSGLGLSIAKGFTEANGGTLTVQSLPGQGTSFVVSFRGEESAELPA